MERNELIIDSGLYDGDTARLNRGVDIDGPMGDTLTIIDRRTGVEHEYFLAAPDEVLRISQALQLSAGPSPAFSVTHRSGVMLSDVPSDEGKEILRIRSLFGK
ncbi:MAG: hypothetical protein ABSE79_09230 [Terriglobia bacterium]|jgi:hypothetical protein